MPLEPSQLPAEPSQGQAGPLPPPSEPSLGLDHSGALQAPSAPAPAPPFIPSFSFAPTHRAEGPDELVLARKMAERELIGLLIERSGVSQAELARRMGITPQALGQYVKAKRRATFHWLVRLAQVCGARVSVEFPSLAAPIRVRATADDL